MRTGSIVCEDDIMANVFTRNCDITKLKDKPLADYEPSELVAYLTVTYPGDPKGALKLLRQNYEVGFVLGETALILLEGLQSVKSNKKLGSIS